MKAVIILSLLAVALAAPAAPSPCTAPAKGVAFDNVACPALNDIHTSDGNSIQYWDYQVVNGDKAGCLHFQVVPGNRTMSANSWILSATVPGTFGLGTSQVGTSPVSASGTKASVLSIDAEFINSDKAKDNKITFGVKLSNLGIQDDAEYGVALWRGGQSWAWNEVGVEGNDGTTKSVGVPCCGSTVSSNVIYGEAHEHIYLDAHITTTTGTFKQANMINAALVSIPDQSTFTAGSAHVRTCVSNQSCSIKGANYYVTVTTDSSNAVDAWYDVNPTYKAGASAVGVSAAALLLVAITSLF